MRLNKASWFHFRPFKTTFMCFYVQSCLEIYLSLFFLPLLKNKLHVHKLQNIPILAEDISSDLIIEVLCPKID